ncbi:hypothetical protein [Nocardia bovistercoris]|uniref:DUF8017 domain-containing protein n=1 Tax=Nocardia bovistercoris TaxID=2785916 RepID=A0A931IEZ1_9NOCA|nr:hypothetical protein [Nocardia bovistercoris]MBH0779145.1 hypothetical protein [Nocardia bovistercoris]
MTLPAPTSGVDRAWAGHPTPAENAPDTRPGTDWQPYPGEPRGAAPKAVNAANSGTAAGWHPNGATTPPSNPYPPGYHINSFDRYFAGGFAGLAPARRNRNTRLWIGAGLAALVLTAGATVAVVADTGAEAAGEDEPSMVSALTTSERQIVPKAPAARSTETPLIPGYQVVVAPDSGAAYDVPWEWTVADSTRTGGVGVPPNAVGGKGYTFEGKNYCPGSTRSIAFLTGADIPDSAAAAAELGIRTARAAYPDSPAGATPGPPEPLDSIDGNQHGAFVETRGAIGNAKPGCATRYTVYTFATPTDTGNFIMVIAADTGVPAAVDPETARRIFTSIRPHES